MSNEWNVIVNGTAFPFETYGAVVQAYSGAGLPPLEHLSTDYVYQPGGRYERTKVQPRQIVLQAILPGTSLTNLHQLRADLTDQLGLLDETSMGTVALEYRGGTVPLRINVRYDAGLEIAGLTSWTEKLALRFVAHDPTFYAPGRGGTVTLNQPAGPAIQGNVIGWAGGTRFFGVGTVNAAHIAAGWESVYGIINFGTALGAGAFAGTLVRATGFGGGWSGAIRSGVASSGTFGHLQAVMGFDVLPNSTNDAICVLTNRGSAAHFPPGTFTVMGIAANSSATWLPIGTVLLSNYIINAGLSYQPIVKVGATDVFIANLQSFELTRGSATGRGTAVEVRSVLHYDGTWSLATGLWREMTSPFGGVYSVPNNSNDDAVFFASNAIAVEDQTSYAYMGGGNISPTDASNYGAPDTWKRFNGLNFSTIPAYLFLYDLQERTSIAGPETASGGTTNAGTVNAGTINSLGMIYALHYRSGTLYIGGNLTSLGGESLPYVGHRTVSRTFVGGLYGTVPVLGVTRTFDGGLSSSNQFRGPGASVANRGVNALCHTGTALLVGLGNGEYAYNTDGTASRLNEPRDSYQRYYRPWGVYQQQGQRLVPVEFSMNLPGMDVKIEQIVHAQGAGITYIRFSNSFSGPTAGTLLYPTPTQVVNTGRAPARPVITITTPPAALNYPHTFYFIRNETTQQTIYLNAVIGRTNSPNGDQFIIDCRTLSVIGRNTTTGATVNLANSVRNASQLGQFALRQGTNILTWLASGTMQVQVTWDDRYWSVDSR